MDITVRKPTGAEAAAMKSQPVWGCEASVFDWSYGDEEIALILEGDVTVTYGDGRSVRFGPGDYVTFPKGLSCMWHVEKAVRKHYMFR